MSVANRYPQDLQEQQLARPFALKPNRILRTYRGGAVLEAFRGYPNPQDGFYPEDWLGSTATSRTRTHSTEGLSTISVEGREVILRDLIRDLPIQMLGEDHVQKFGPDPFMLVKLLDSAERLRIQVHPTCDQARSLFGTNHGKTEAWIVLETRCMDGVKPYILLGFREGVIADDFKEAVLNQRADGLEAMLHRIEVRPGDVFLVNAGTPHAIGTGVFMVEIQEPSDLTINVEAVGNDFKAESGANHLGIGWDKALGLFNYTGSSFLDNLKSHKINASLVRHGPGASEHAILLGEEVEPYFGVVQYTVTESISIGLKTFCIAIVIDGEGQILSRDRELTIQRGDAFFMPAILGSYDLVSRCSKKPLKVLNCYPPSAYA